MTDFKAIVRKHKGNQRAAARELHIDEKTLRRRLREGSSTPVQARSRATPAAAPTPARGRSLESFKQEFDRATIIPSKIRAALTAMGDTWLYETEFIKQAGVSTPELGDYRDQFNDHVLEVRARGKAPRRIWAGTVKLATKMRGMV